MDIEGIYELLVETLQTIVALHQVSSSCRVLDCIVPTTLSLIACLVSRGQNTNKSSRQCIHASFCFSAECLALCSLPAEFLWERTLKQDCTCRFALARTRQRYIMLVQALCTRMCNVNDWSCYNEKH